MAKTGLNIFIGFNVLAGMYFLGMGIWPTSEKTGVVMIIFSAWGVMFFGLAAAIWMRASFARMWSIILYGLIAAVICLNLVGELLNAKSLIGQYPLVYGVIYLLWLAAAVGPVVFMLREDVKEEFSPKQPS